MTTATINLNITNPAKVFNKNIYSILTDYSHFTEVHYGGGSSGKSHGVVQKVVLKALQDWKYSRKILWLRKVGATIADSLFQDVKGCLVDFKMWDFCEWNKTDNRITLPNGAVFLFKGMDNSEKIKSIKGISDVVMEEASEFHLNDYTQLTLRLREKKHKQKQIFLMFNPVSKLNWVYKYFFTGEPHRNTLIRQSSYKDNKFLDDVTRQNLEDLANRNPAYYKIYALGEFATLDKLVFPKYDTDILNKDDLRHLPSFFGLDYGYINDPSAFIHVKLDKKHKKLYILGEYVKTGMMNDELANVIKQLGYGKERITADSAEKKSIAEMKREGVERIKPSMKGADSIIAGIQFISQFDIIVDERCYKTIEELDNYTWKKDKHTDEYYNEPVDTYNHCIDALRYAVEELMIKNREEKKDTKELRRIKQLF
ncbi:PBSX family phage terminase large subunit [Staphylococcus sp. 18_1_E_LY]|uniref:PBSX family phage terminase large subunit n=1 Tax=Staphylococcus lloydii TaxID=2781774 RepID=A0A7T1AZK8_9STAP|nr:PBSX family phage terminase large subunit [Staphylococcus lloydii]MBF7019631.1 PBSX family phage terminase large subunit [Staphylococcus lloydii]MBF7027359.1 PBSX family phage terminase large subunit [Staphylococcus lloydii]MDU9419007.1 PBSX family phage terminase large subunit [Staphylococcus lloydii]QPM75022.1 PBSX family phage terminase large subunit [Staphylococcus lloydii]